MDSRLPSAPIAACLLGAFAGLPLPTPALGHWRPQGAPVSVADYFQYPTSAAPDGHGGVYVAVYHSGIDGRAVFVQRLTSKGEVAPGWPANGISLGFGQNQVVLADGAGGVFVAWDDYRDIHATRLTSEGAVSPGWPIVVCGESGNQKGPVLAPDGGGGVFVAWNDGRSGVRNEIFMQRLTGLGDIAPVWPHGGRGVAAPAWIGVGIPKMVSDPAGGVWLAWEDERLGSPYAQRVGPSGTIARGWDSGGNPFGPSYGIRPEIVADGAGGAIVAWQDPRNYGTLWWDTYAQHIGANGAPIAGWPAGGLAVGDLAYYQSNPALVHDGAGGALITWADEFRSLVGLHLTSDGQIAPGWSLNGVQLGNGEGGLTLPRMLEDGAGGAIITFHYGGVAALRVTATGAAAPGWRQGGVSVTEGTPADYHFPTVSDDRGGVIVVWPDFRDGQDPHINPDVYAQRVTATGRVCSRNATPALGTTHPPCGSVILAVVGEPLLLTWVADDDDADDELLLSAPSAPSAAVFTPPLPAAGNPASTTLQWIPSSADVGSHEIELRAEDRCGDESRCAVTVQVTTNRAPDCSHASAAEPELWPPTHEFLPVSIEGIVEPDGDPVTIAIAGITQDESLDDTGDGSSCPDARIDSDGRAWVRAERNGGMGNGRVYSIAFRASDGRGGSCVGTVPVCVPYDRGQSSCVDDGKMTNSLGPCGGDSPLLQPRLVKHFDLAAVSFQGGRLIAEYHLPSDTEMMLALYDVAGRLVAILDRGMRRSGVHRPTLDMGSLAPGLYFSRLRAGGHVATKRVFVLE